MTTGGWQLVGGNWLVASGEEEEEEEEGGAETTPKTKTSHVNVVKKRRGFGVEGAQKGSLRRPGAGLATAFPPLILCANGCQTAAFEAADKVPNTTSKPSFKKNARRPAGEDLESSAPKRGNGPPRRQLGRGRRIYCIFTCLEMACKIAVLCTHLVQALVNHTHSFAVQRQASSCWVILEKEVLTPLLNATAFTDRLI